MRQPPLSGRVSVVVRHASAVGLLTGLLVRCSQLPEESVFRSPVPLCAEWRRLTFHFIVSAQGLMVRAEAVAESDEEIVRRADRGDLDSKRQFAAAVREARERRGPVCRLCDVARGAQEGHRSSEVIPSHAEIDIDVAFRVSEWHCSSTDVLDIGAAQIVSVICDESTDDLLGGTGQRADPHQPYGHLRAHTFAFSPTSIAARCQAPGKRRRPSPREDPPTTPRPSDWIDGYPRITEACCGA